MGAVLVFAALLMAVGVGLLPWSVLIAAAAAAAIVGVVQAVKYFDGG